MDDQVKAKWLAALRSGEYKQAKEKLAAVNQDGEITGYCCLGVLCDLAVKEGVIPTPIVVDTCENPARPANGGDRMFYGDGGYTVYSSATELPKAVSDWAGLYDNSPFVTASVPVDDDGDDSMVTSTRSLSELNDDFDFDFNNIADLIEAEL